MLWHFHFSLVSWEHPVCKSKYWMGMQLINCHAVYQTLPDMEKCHHYLKMLKPEWDNKKCKETLKDNLLIVWH